MTETEPFFLYHVIDYLATGEGRTLYLFINRYYEGNEILKLIEDEVNNSFWFSGIKSFSEEDFFKYYENFLPEPIKKIIDKKTVPVFSYHQKLHFNYL